MKWLLLLCLTCTVWAENDSLVSGDFDGDGKIDVVLTRPYDFLFFRNLGAGTFAPPVTRDVQTERSWVSSFAGRIDGDQRDDLVVVRDGRPRAWSGAERPLWTGELKAVQSVVWLPGRLVMGSGKILRSYPLQPDGKLGKPGDIKYPAEIWSVTAVGDQALAVAQSPDIRSASVYQARDGFRKETLVPFGSPIGRVMGADFNGDGRLEWVSLVHPTLRLWDNGKVRVYPAEILSASQGFVADFNGDGLPDLLGVTGYGATLYSGERRRALGPGRALAPAYVVAAGDWNGDGRPDFVCADSSNPVLTFYTNQGDGRFNPWELKW